MKPEVKDSFYNSKVWKRTRNAYSQSVGYLCEKCLEQGLYVTGEIVHHIIPITLENINNPEITLNFSNLKLLCRSCHERIHRRQASRYKVDEQGHITPIGE